MQVRFEERVQLAPNIWEYTFTPERRVDFIPGQYVDFRMPELQGDPRGRSRTFTLTSLPDEPTITFVVKSRTPLSPYKRALEALVPGDELKIGDAMGDLILPKLKTTPLVYVAGGIGMSSYASMFKQLIAAKEEREIYLFYRLRDRREQIFRELTSGYPLALNTLAIAPHEFTAEDIVSSTPPGAQTYLSGSQTFVEGMRVGLAEQGIPHERIVFDYFDGYADL